ncbi:MAG: phosphate/phosphite/phosphonate ABC transporter substrate-binding protein [Psychromonas sp.]|nr:phosphate/phosphite/phosphonate ABC transporter substrate-binding protein [Alteromonadales bacterium]MCP5077196.1 phosphate/phosphite/phosphonate ABC transporter substrate-binding protein [Psychromonas sp.]
MQIIIILLICLMVSACEPVPERYQPSYSKDMVRAETIYIIGVHPLHNPQRLHEVFSPLIEYLNSNSHGISYRLEASRNYASFDKKLADKKFHFALPNPFQTIKAIDNGYRVFAKMGDDHNFRGIILIRKHGGINEPTDLIGKAVSYPAPTALAATMMPQLYLQQNGVNVMQDLDNRYVGSQESSIMNLFLGTTVAASTWPPPWQALSKERPELAEQLMIKWQTEPLINNSFVVRKDIPEEHVKFLASLLTALHEHADGQKILQRIELSKFELASDETYLVIREFIKTYNQQVKNISQ